MADYYLVEQAKGPGWDHSRARREQAGWDEHAAFMDALVESGFVVLGGPFDDDRTVLLIVDAESEAAIRERLAADPWSRNGMLTLGAIERFTVLLGG